jgi:hypothetical protein
MINYRLLKNATDISSGEQNNTSTRNQKLDYQMSLYEIPLIIFLTRDFVSILTPPQPEASKEEAAKTIAIDIPRVRQWRHAILREVFTFIFSLATSLKVRTTGLDWPMDLLSICAGIMAARKWCAGVIAWEARGVSLSRIRASPNAFRNTWSLAEGGGYAARDVRGRMGRTGSSSAVQGYSGGLLVVLF